MTRRTIPPRKVEALARECRELLDWLRGAGAAAPPESFSRVKRGYVALVEAVSLLPRGPNYLKETRALPPIRGAYPFASTDRTADSFTLDELVDLEDPLLTKEGVIVPAELLPHVEWEQLWLEAKGESATTKDALKAILTRLAYRQGRSVHALIQEKLGTWETRVSRARSKRLQRQQ